MKAWTTVEASFIREHAALGARKIARRLGRSETSVRSAACRFGVSLRTPGQRRGALLGAPRGAVLRGLRAELLGEPERHLCLCPDCGYREQVRSLGRCRTCHLRHLTSAHMQAVLLREKELEEQEEAELEAKRELLMWRQRSCRLGATTPREGVASRAL